MVDSLVRDGWAIAAAMMSAVLLIGVALAFVESQWGALSGRPGMMAAAFDKIVFLAVCVLVVAAATATTNILQGSVASALSGSREGLARAFTLVGTIVADILIAAASLMVTLGILGGSVAGQVSVTLGRAAGVSDAMGRILGAIVFGVGAALTVPVAHAIVNAVGRAVAGAAP